MKKRDKFKIIKTNLGVVSALVGVTFSAGLLIANPVQAEEGDPAPVEVVVPESELVADVQEVEPAKEFEGDQDSELGEEVQVPESEEFVAKEIVSLANENNGQENENSDNQPEVGFPLASEEDQAPQDTEIVTDPSGVERISGRDRFANSVAISRDGFDQADTVILAAGPNEKMADALTGIPFARQYDAPVLLTRPDRVDQVVLDEIKRLKAKNVYILGGHSTVNPEVEELVRKQGLNVERIGGKNRYEQASLIAERVMDNKELRNPEVKKHEVYLVNGQAYADAMSIAPFAAQDQTPIFLTRSDVLDAHVQKNLGRISKVYLVGGTRSISKTVEDVLKQNGIETHRFGGSNRYAVNRNILNYHGVQGDEIYVASGEHVSDGIPAANLAGKNDKGLLLVKNDNILNLKDQIGFINEKTQVDEFKLIGGTRTLSKDTEDLFRNSETIDQYERVVSRTSLNSKPFIINKKDLGLYSQPQNVLGFKKLGNSTALLGQYVEGLETAKLSDGTSYTRVVDQNGKQAWIRSDALKGENFISSVKYYPQLNNNAKVSWGCAGAAGAMVLSANGHTFNWNQLRNFMVGVPRKNQTPYGQDGNIFSGAGFTQVVQPEAMVPYMQRWDSNIINFTGASTEDVIAKVLNGKPVMYYGYTWSDNDRNPNEARNHAKVIVGFKDGRFNIYDPVYQYEGQGPGLFGRTKYDRGTKHTITIRQFEEEINHRPGHSQRRPDRQFITYR